MTRDPVVAHCTAVLRGASRTFSSAARLLPRRPREGASLLYAWVRHCDDVIDNQVLGHGQRAGDPIAQAEQLRRLRDATGNAIDGSPGGEPVFVAIGRVVRDHGVPRDLPFRMLDGLAMDVDGRRYQTIDELTGYCFLVAGVLGVMTAHLMDATSRDALALAADLGIGFQLTNIARDVMDDAAAGRVYLPLEWLTEHHVPPEQVADPPHRAAVARVVARVVDRADHYYATTDRNLGSLAFRPAWATATARGVYAEIGRLVRERGARAWDQRAVVATGRRIGWAGRGLLAAMRRSPVNA